MIRKLCAQDRDCFLAMLDEFYHSPATTHTIPPVHYERTFEMALSESPFVEVYIFEQAGAVAGYAQISYTYSTEAGGLVAWLEEVYVRPAYQGEGIGAEFLRYFEAACAGRVARLRLEVERENTRAYPLYERMGYRYSPYVQMHKDLEDTART